ncbi:hypothetical protein CONLIGDRAFT_638380 [Coniochaeta ligniaria NRRL 30616]|uniref:Uncharacterized protein n=1 Tax=Coniochaeta ligniaria NRRL 30616 TaxID=1408157 RepID=A0A1J7IZT1_9PEZI|nr:hypothetical protein CONLIGDRAFT_638380 [Coniochaeta ligniaria NRRL 30616]
MGQERKSINQLLRENARERLFVPTLCWTDRQLALLGCSFVDEHDSIAVAGRPDTVSHDSDHKAREAPTTAPGVDNNPNLSPHGTASTRAGDLQQLPTFSPSHGEVQALTSTFPCHETATGHANPTSHSGPGLMVHGDEGQDAHIDPSSPWGCYFHEQTRQFIGVGRDEVEALHRMINTSAQSFHRCRRRIPFRFAGRAVDKVEAVFFSPKHASLAHPGRPLIAFAYTHIVYNQRRRHFHLRTDRPLLGRAAIKLEAVQPKDCLKDPYLVAVLIAIAQHARWSDASKGGGGPDAYPKKKGTSPGSKLGSG